MPIAVRSLESSTERYLRNCIRAYFGGTRNLRWIVGVTGGAKAQARVIVDTQFSHYAGSQAYRDLWVLLND